VWLFLFNNQNSPPGRVLRISVPARGRVGTISFWDWK